MDEGKEGDEVPEWRLPVSADTPEVPSEPSQQENGPAGAPPSDPDEPPSAAGATDETRAEPSTASTGASTGNGGRRKHRGLAAAVVVVVLIAAGSIYLIGSRGHHSTTSPPTSSRKPGQSTAPPTTENGGTTTTTSPLPVYSTAKIVDTVDPAVVDINTVTQVDTGYAETAATGMIISPNGYILTNNHVVNDATTITVTIDHRTRTFSAKFVGADPTSDIAVIKVEGLTSLPTVRFGRSADLGVGTKVVAIGNALGRGGTPTVTTGSVVALNRSITATDELSTYAEHLSGMIQASSTIQPGNSGGPLIDDHAQIVGMNTAANTQGLNGDAFAIPIDRVQAIVAEIESGRPARDVVFGVQAFLGLVVRNVASKGVYISRIIFGFPAAAAGVEPGDVVLAFDGRKPSNANGLKKLIIAHQPGDSATLTVQSPAGTLTFNLTLVPGPAR